MEIIKDTEMQFGYIAGRLSFPGHSLTMIVKGTFDLVPGGPATLAEEQEYPTGDLPHPEDEEGTGASIYEQDFAYFKPRADLLLFGKCRPAGGQAKQVAVTFGIGCAGRTLNVFGERGTFTEPKLFAAIDLRYENAGSSRDNPVGMSGKPHLEDIGGGKSPAGFGPLGREWRGRNSMVGTYKGSYVKERWPWFPKDFDFGYFNAAPPELQVADYLVGDEAILMQNIHPEHPLFKGALPGLRARCFAIEGKEREPADFGAEDLRELKMVLDTAWIDAEANKLILVWRGVTPCSNEEAPELTHAFFTHESLADTPRTREELIARLHELTSEEIEDQAFAPPFDPQEYETLAAQLQAEAAKNITEANERLAAQGVPPPDPGPMSEEQQAEMNATLAAWGVLPEAEGEGISREVIQRRAAEGDSFADEDLSGLDLSELSLAGLVFCRANLTGARLTGADLTGADLTEAVLEAADLGNAKLVDAVMVEADLLRATLDQADLSGANLETASFEEASLRQATLDRARATSAELVGATLVEASLREAILDSADLSAADISQATFEGASLKEASINGATGLEVNMQRADLTELRADDDCDLRRGDFRRAQAKLSAWNGARLTEAQFAAADLERADFSKASLDKASFVGAECREGVFRAASLRGAQFVAANALEGVFEKADLRLADFTGSNLYGSELLDADTEGTIFKSTNLKMTKLAGKMRQ